MFKNKTVLITGGTGTLGNALTKRILKENLKKLIIFSRDELKQYEMQQKFNSNKLRFFLGDVRDPNRLFRALNGVNIVIAKTNASEEGLVNVELHAVFT